MEQEFTEHLFGTTAKAETLDAAQLAAVTQLVTMAQAHPNVSVTDLISIAKMFCTGGETALAIICPIVQSLP